MLLTQKTIYYFNVSCIGDNIACLPVVNFIQKEVNIDGSYVIVVLRKNYELFKQFVPVDRLLVSEDIDPNTQINPECLVKLMIPYIGVVINNNTFTAPARMQICEQAYYEFFRRMPKDSKHYKLPVYKPEKEYTNSPIPENYIVMPSCSFADNRQLSPRIMDAIVEHAISKGLSVVLLGKQEEIKTSNMAIPFKQRYTNDKCIDLTDKTTLEETLAIISKAKMYVGYDSGLAYMAALCERPVINAFTCIKSEYRIPVVNSYYKAIEADCFCSGCCSNSQVERLNANSCFFNTYECLDAFNISSFTNSMDEVIK